MSDPAAKRRRTRADAHNASKSPTARVGGKEGFGVAFGGSVEKIRSSPVHEEGYDVSGQGAVQAALAGLQASEGFAAASFSEVALKVDTRLLRYLAQRVCAAKVSFSKELLKEGVDKGMTTLFADALADGAAMDFIMFLLFAPWVSSLLYTPPLTLHTPVIPFHDKIK